MSFSRTADTLPACSAARSFVLKNEPSGALLSSAAPGSSSSSPACTAATVECVAPQSDCTTPLKPHSFFSTVVSRYGFSHAYTPFSLLYEHITLPGWPSFTPISNASSSASRMVRSSTTESIVIRLVSWSLNAKCLIVAITFCACVACVRAALSVPASTGSSPMYSNVRPLRGSRARFTPPPSPSANPSARSSSAMRVP